jgi:hypothetical protein
LTARILAIAAPCRLNHRNVDFLHLHYTRDPKDGMRAWFKTGRKITGETARRITGASALHSAESLGLNPALLTVVQATSDER